MPRKAKGLGARAEIDRELLEIEEKRERLLAARAALDGEAVLPKQRAPRVSQDQVAAFLRENPDSTYLEVADGMGISPVVAAKHLSRGQMADRFRNSAGKWSIRE